MLSSIVLASGCSSEQSQNKQLVNDPDSPALKLKAAKQTEYPLVLKDACREEVTIPSEPQRVAVDNDELKDFMKVIGASDKIVEVTEDSASSLWGARETILAKSKPDFFIYPAPSVLVYPGSEMCMNIQSFRTMGFPIWVTGHSEIARIASDMLTVGIILNRRELAEQASDKLGKVIAQVKEARKGMPVKKIYWELGYNRSFSKNNQVSSVGVGKNTLEDDLLSTAGGENILPWLDNQSPDSFPTTLEQLRKADPDLILYQNYFRSPEYVPPEEREEWQSLRAIRTSQLYVYPFDEMRYSGLPDNLMALLKAIHPEAYSRITVNN
ncbi:ABC transporter substrate-binding protein [Paenibacillus sp. UNC499MF]|uniref:ABC transporter substrate-binding protein n=1 Tax=Paenibacillus sp. UNC499MF TaxID=1502751 RepID=UPI002155FDD0|nr:ABC transporter substrate-binding protein [Paenibacillus sp. UNC499MF]